MFVTDQLSFQPCAGELRTHRFHLSGPCGPTQVVAHMPTPAQHPVSLMDAKDHRGKQMKPYSLMAVSLHSFGQH